MNILCYSLLSYPLLILFGIITLYACYLAYKGFVWIMQEIIHYDYISELKSRRKDYNKINAYKYRKSLIEQGEL